MSDAVRPVAMPDGPKVFIAEIGKEVGTFTAEPGGGKPALRHHVPLKCRGPYRPEELANYDPQSSYRTDPLGYLLCGKFTGAGEKCSKRAVNRAPACIVHGGRLHPMDKLRQKIPEDKEAEELSRYQQFLAKQITVDDLDDEELACCGFRGKNGVIYRPRNVPREMASGFQKAIFERAHAELRANTVDAARTIAEIMKNTTIEPDIRLKAASILLDRNLGKAPQVVALTADKAFEEIFSDLFTGTREQSRAIRGNIVDAEIIDERRDDIKTDGIQHNSTEYAEQPVDNSPVSVSLVSQPQDISAVIADQSHSDKGQRDARLFERNEAILAQTIEVKPFEYDLEDHRVDVKKAIQKRFASRALGVDLTTPDYSLQRVEENGFIRWIDPIGQANIKPSKTAEKRRKTYTLSDFD